MSANRKPIKNIFKGIDKIDRLDEEPILAIVDYQKQGVYYIIFLTGDLLLKTKYDNLQYAQTPHGQGEGDTYIYLKDPKAVDIYYNCLFKRVQDCPYN